MEDRRWEVTSWQILPEIYCKYIHFIVLVIFPKGNCSHWSEKAYATKSGKHRPFEDHSAGLSCHITGESKYHHELLVTFMSGNIKWSSVLNLSHGDSIGLMLPPDFFFFPTVFWWLIGIALLRFWKLFNWFSDMRRRIITTNKKLIKHFPSSQESKSEAILQPGRTCLN